MIETQEITFEDVVRAGRILFGPAFVAEAAGWRHDLRSAYRRRALETHPDRASALGRRERELIREFAAVSDAYRILSTLRSGPLPRGPVYGPPPRPPSRPARGPQPARAPPRPAHGAATRPAHGAEHAARRSSAPPPPRAPAEPPRRARGAERAAPARGPRVRVGLRPQDLPQRRLRFAEYLYYSGRVNWTDVADAIAWQRAQRPSLGRIAIRFGFLDPGDVAVLLERRREAGAAGVPFGEWAVRQGYLTPFQLLAALGQQLRLQRPIGQFFVERGLIDADDVDLVRRRLLRHNSRFFARAA